MNLMCKIYCVLWMLFFVQCKEKTYDNNSSKKINIGYTICIQPFTNIDSTIVLAVRDSIKQFYQNVIIKENKPLPEFAYFEKNNRYKADSLLQYLSTISTENELMIGLTNKDISTTKNNIQDWGVMGLGKCPGNSCIASTYRLQKENIKSQLFKVSIHELDHTQGLPHCSNKTCFMRDVEGKNPTNEEIGFCADCTAFLKRKNWKL
jgi:archaemetzincin